MENIALVIDEVINYMISFGPLGGFILVMFESLLPPLPLGLIVGLNMLSFGKIPGFLLSYFANITGCMLSFWLFRYFIKDKYTHWIKEKHQDELKKWMKKMSNIKFETLAVLFAIPLTPAFLVNIAGGLSDISIKKYLIALLIGKPAMLLFYGYITVSLVDSLTNPTVIIKVIVLVLITYIISKVIEKVVKVDE